MSDRTMASGRLLLGAVLITAFALMSMGTQVAANEPAEVSADGAVAPAPETARPVAKKPLTVAPRATTPRVDAAPKKSVEKADVKRETASDASRTLAPQTDLSPSAPTESLVGVGLKLLLGSIALAAALYFAARWLKRMPFAKLLPGADGPIKVIGRTHLGPKASLCLIEVAGTTLLLSQTATNVETLHVWPAGSTSAVTGERPSLKAPATPAATFPAQLKHLETRLTGRQS